MTNFCKDCAHFIKEHRTNVKYGKCCNDEVLKEFARKEILNYDYLVSPDVLEGLPYCSISRKFSRCGPEGKFFKEKMFVTETKKKTMLDNLKEWWYNQ